MKQLDTVVGEITRRVMLELQAKEVTEQIGVFSNMDNAVEACFIAQKKLVKLTLAQRGALIEGMRKTAIENAEWISKAAVEESKMGKWEDKLVKNLLAAKKTPGIEDLKTEAMSGDNGLTLVELSPFGVIGAITPTTNPTETIICNSIGMIAAGNGIVFSPHPTAKNISLKLIQLINQSIVNAGGPRNVITTVSQPTIEQANLMMKHPKVNMLVATGGPGVVRAVLSTGKKAIGAGAGNPPAVIDETADIEKAAKDVILGCSFDNNLPCIAEKEVIVVEQVADYLIFCMKSSGAYFIEDAPTLRRLEELLVNDGQANKDYIGKPASYILEQVGITADESVKVISMETYVDHPFVQHELMMPVLPVVRVKDINAAINTAVAVEHGLRHTAIMHSKNIDNLSALAKAIQTTIFVKNSPSYAGIGVGGEGYTTFTIAGPTGEGLTSAKSFTRNRRCVLADSFNIK